MVPPGTWLWRVHPGRIEADEFAANNGEGASGGRFDSPDDGYWSMYVSFHQTTAVAEQFLPGRTFTQAGMRTLPRKKLAGMMASAVKTTKTTELTLLRLVFEEDFVALRQSDEWLVTAEEHDYPLTRRWAGWLRDQVDTVHGIIWQSRADMPRQTAVLFEDRCPPGALRVVTGTSVELDDVVGARWLTETLQHYRIRVQTPRPADWPLIFLNYRSTDDTAAVELLDRELTARLGDQAVFRDHRSIAPGTRYEPELIEKAKRCRVLLVLIGPRWEQIHGHRPLDDENDYVRREIAAALAQRRVSVVPVLIGPRGLLRPEDLPEDIRSLAGLQVLTLKHRYTQHDVVMLVNELFATVPVLQ
ncbi:MAG: RES domain-containing protein [Actinomycetota bacterium]|nr:RES domain-containing protein [Actinomycetota bacterium]